MNEPEAKLPYSLFKGKAGGFLILEFPKSKIALPYIALRQITLHEGPERIVMEFTEQNIEVQGKGLDSVFGFLATLQVEALRVGIYNRDGKVECEIQRIEP
jgi:hypothetical protein